MQINFYFKKDDPIVKSYLKENEINTVNRWQTDDTYEFEFHTGHDTGYPIYIRPDRCSDKSNLPKFDTRNKSKFHYRRILNFANGNKLSHLLQNKAQNEILDIIDKQWTTLQILSRRYWEGEHVGTGKSVLEKWGESETADTGQHETEISKAQLRKILGGH